MRFNIAMKIGVMSDSHDNMKAIEEAVGIFNRIGADMVIHAGDYISPFTAKKFADLRSGFVGVFGNNDGERLGLLSQFRNIGKIHNDPHEATIGGKRFFITHSLSGIADILANSGEYDVIIYGHTHKADIRKVNGALVVNPGECGGWISGKGTVAVIDTEKGKAEIINL